MTACLRQYGAGSTGAIFLSTMNVCRWLLLLVCLGAVSAPAFAQGNIRKVALGGSVINLRVTINKAETVAADVEVSEILVGNSEIADVVVLTNKSLYVLGKKAGTTSVSILNDKKRVIALLNVEVTYDVDGLKRMLQQHIGRDLAVQSNNGKILISGTVSDSPSISRAMAIAEQFAPGAVSHALTLRGSQQVLLEVRFVEAKRESSRDLGINWEITNSRVSSVIGIGGLASNATPFGIAVARLLDSGTTADVIIQALEKRGLARRLAEPNLVALSGDTASFLAGGEFPFPVQSDKDKITIEFKKFGVGLAFTPTVLGGGLINIKIEPEVSELDPTASLRVAGVEIPGLSVRRAQTTIELRDGQSFAMAGLLQSANLKNTRELPWIGQVPVLGALFRSAAYQQQETDLVIIVTPRIVQPATPGQNLRTPLDGHAPANDPDFFARGQLEVKTNQPQGLRGHVLDIGAEKPVAFAPGGTK